MKILYISPENTVGTLNLWKKGHEELGNQCRYITFYPSMLGYKDDIVLNLPLVGTSQLYIQTRRLLQMLFYKRDPLSEKNEKYPQWIPVNFLEKYWFYFRDYLWSNKIEKVIEKYKLDEFDVFHFEWGLDFYRDCRFAKRMKDKGKYIICHYHGPDIRTRGVIPRLDNLSNINLTNEVDLLEKHPKIDYLFLPYDTKKHKKKKSINSPIRLFHSTMNRYYKGSELIINICNKLEKKYKVEFILMEREPHQKVMETKSKCDINIDQVSNTGGWGYGMNSIESLSMGICTATNMNSQMKTFLPNHPFYEINKNTLYEDLELLITSPEKIMKYGEKGRKWVEKNHHYSSVVQSLYQIYKSNQIL
jgi:hypothetical protein